MRDRRGYGLCVCVRFLTETKKRGKVSCVPYHDDDDRIVTKRCSAYGLWSQRLGAGGLGVFMVVVA